MKKKIYMIFAAFAAVFSACSKEAIKTDVKVGVPMTVTVSIANNDSPAVKATYTDTQDGLKMRWEAGDKISIVSVSSNSNSGKAVTCDTFVAQGSGRVVEFAGTYTGALDAPLIRAVYPALTKEDDTNWGSDAGDDGPYNSCFTINKGATSYSRYDLSYINQLSNGDLSMLQNFDYMYGICSFIDDGNLSVELQKGMSLAKCVIDASIIPDGTSLDSFELFATDDSGERLTLFTYSDWSYTYAPYYAAGNGHSYIIRVYLGMRTSTYVYSHWKKTSDMNEMVFYLPVMKKVLASDTVTIPAGTTLTVSVQTTTSGLAYQKSMKLKSDFDFEVGKVHTITATLDHSTK